MIKRARSLIDQFKQRKLRRALRGTEFWCDAHWAMIDQEGAHPGKATVNIAAGLAMLGATQVGTRHACCYFTDETVKGVLRLSRAK